MTKKPWQKLVSWEQKELLRWNKKHFSFLKGLQSSKITQYFLEGEGPTLKKQQVEKKKQQKKQNEIIKNFMAPFYEWGSTASRLEPLCEGRSLYSTKFPEIPGTHFINLRMMKGWVDLGVTQWFSACSSIDLHSNLVNNVFASVHYRGFNMKLLFFTPKALGVSLTLCQKVVNTAGVFFLPGGENLRRNDFDDSKIFQS